MNSLGLIISIALAVFALSRVKRFRPGDWASLLAYIIIISMAVPFIPKALPPPPSPRPMTVAGMISELLYITYGIISSIPGGSSIVGLLKSLANALIGIMDFTIIMMAIYAIGYYIWQYMPVLIAIGLVMSITDWDTAYIIGYLAVSLPIIASVILPFITFIIGLMPPGLGGVRFVIVTSHPTPLFIITNNAYAFTPTLIVTNQPIGQIYTVWDWLIVNNTASQMWAGWIGIIHVNAYTPNPITYGNGTCGAYMGIMGRNLDNCTIIAYTSMPVSIWLWGSGAYTNTSLFKVGNKSIIACNMTIRPVSLYTPVSLDYYFSYLGLMPGVRLPSPRPGGYRQYQVNITPGFIIINKTIYRPRCLVKLYGVMNNTWYGSSPLAYTRLMYSIISMIEGIRTGSYVDRILYTILFLAGLGGIGWVTSKQLIGWLQRILGQS